MDEPGKADFNMAVSYLNGLNAMFLSAAYFQTQVDIRQWYHTLLAIYSGIGCWMNKDEQSDMEFKLKELHDKVIMSNSKGLKNGYYQIDKDTFWKMLKINQDFLRIAKDKNLLMRMKEDRTSGLSE